MIRLTNESVVWKNNAPVPCAGPQDGDKHATMSYAILDKHNTSSDPSLYRIRFDALTSHDITYVGIIQTARASGLEKFPMPYAMTNCHNSLCAVGGTINEDDHVFGLSAAIKYGGVFVPPNTAVIHQYAREKLARCGAMVLGSDSHTRYGALGTMGVGEGGPELVKQLLENTYDVPAPQVVLVYLTGKPKHGVGPHDVAIALCQAVFANGFVKNKVLEFVGPGIASLGMDFRIGIDVMTTETTCLSSIWETDEKVQEFYMNHGRPQDYAPMHPQDGARYDSMIEIDLSAIEAMIALPFHPSNAVTIHELLANPEDILRSVEVEAAKKFGSKANLRLTDKVRNGKVYVDQGVIAGCAGGMYDNICAAEAILSQKSTGNGYFSLSVYPSSLPVNMALIKNGVQAGLMEAGAIFKPCFCGPCFGAGDVPANNGLSIRHTTRNFPNREGSKPGEGQLAAVALMDSRSIAATAANGGVLTAATDVEYTENFPAYTYDDTMYQKRIYQGFGDAKSESELKFGPNITDWPKMQPLSENILLKLDAVIHDPVTTTDELIPSGETSSYRSNPLRLAEFALSRRVPSYVADAKATNQVELARQAVVSGQDADVSAMIQALKAIFPGKSEADYCAMLQNTSMGSCVFANRPGDGSAREQAASCQKVLGGAANICYEYATKRYRSNCINWGMLPFTLDADTPFDYETGDYVYIPGVREAVEKGITVLEGTVLTKNGTSAIKLNLAGLTDDEKQILLDGCLINYYAAHH